MAEERLPDYRPVAGWPKLPDGVELGPVSAVATDPNGTVYVLHRGKRPILAFGRDGTLLRSFGHGVIKTGHGLRVDPDRDVWVTDIGSHQVFKFDADGAVVLTLGRKEKPGDGADQFNKPTDIAFAANRDFFVTDGYGNNRVVKFDKRGKYLKEWGKKGTGPGEFNLPHAIVTDDNDRLYVGDRENNRIQLFDGDGKFLGQWKEGGAPFGLYAAGDRLFVADGRANWVVVLDAKGKPLGRFGEKGTAAGQFRLPHMLCVDGDGAVYVAEVDGKRVQKFVAAKEEDLTVLKTGPEGVPPRKMLSTFLKAECQKHFDARKKAVAELKTPDDVKKRQHDLREKFIAALGGFPEKTPLNAKVVGTIEGDGYRIEKVIYESRPNHHVTANLYLPAGKGPFPGVLLPCGHSLNGKANEAYQRACMLLAVNGIAALTYDPIGQGERMQILDGQGKPIVSNTTEHTMLGVGSLLVGRSTASYRIWDGIRSLDYLASRPEVDPKRLGCTGVSGGGTLTSYLMALDERIVCAAPACYITSLERLFATIGPQDAEQNITGQVAFGMDHADYITMRAPRPTLVLCATRDFFDIQGTWASFREAKQVYGLMGHPERVDIVEINAGHGYPKAHREAMVNWMRRLLLAKDGNVTEPEFTVRKDAELQCTRTGQVLEDFKGKSVVDLNVETEKELAAKRKKAWEAMTKEQQRAAVRKVLALPEKVPAARKKVVGKEERDGFVWEQVVFETEQGIFVPARVFRPENPKPRYVVYVSDGTVPELEKIKIPLAAGRMVIALDVRGFGETAPGKANADRPSHFGVDFRESFLTLHLGRPLLGQRTYDLLTVMNHLEEQKATSVSLIGVGAAGPVALHATFLHDGKERVTLVNSLSSWASVVRTPVSYNQLTNAVHGALVVYDLPDLNVENLKVMDPVDATGKPLGGR
jgi:DNA-binding beta-propeller fold protein YncE/dienelactone hydrolase